MGARVAKAKMEQSRRRERIWKCEDVDAKTGIRDKAVQSVQMWLRAGNCWRVWEIMCGVVVVRTRQDFESRQNG